MHLLVEVPVADDGSDLELIGDRLWALGAVGVEERADAIVGAFDDAAAAAAAAHAFGCDVRPVADSEGLDSWRDHAQRVTAGPFTIRPPWLEPGPGIDLAIDPGHTFGSGSHPSTRLAVALLAPRVGPGTHVVDLGAGSGVLAIAAALLGASVTAIDIDPGSAAAIGANADRNGVRDRIEIITADIATATVAADLAVLNVTIDIHERVAAALAEQSIGTLLVAGLLAGDQERRAARAHDRAITDRAVEGEWVALALDHGATTAPS